MTSRQASGPDPQQFLEVRLDQAKQRRVARPPRSVDPARDLHAQPEAGGRVAGTRSKRSLPPTRAQSRRGGCQGRSASMLRDRQAVPSAARSPLGDVRTVPMGEDRVTKSSSPTHQRRSRPIHQARVERSRWAPSRGTSSLAVTGFPNSSRSRAHFLGEEGSLPSRKADVFRRLGSPRKRAADSDRSDGRWSTSHGDAQRAWTSRGCLASGWKDRLP